MNYQSEWESFIRYLEEHPGAFDKWERLGIKWADLEIKRLRKMLGQRNGLKARGGQKG
jgi:hypothetical protein